jgi:hypothetical protein
MPSRCTNRGSLNESRAPWLRILQQMLRRDGLLAAAYKITIIANVTVA